MDFILRSKFFHILLFWLTGISMAGAQGPGGFNTNLRLWLKANAGITGRLDKPKFELIDKGFSLDFGN